MIPKEFFGVEPSSTGPRQRVTDRKNDIGPAGERLVVRDQRVGFGRSKGRVWSFINSWWSSRPFTSKVKVARVTGL